MKQPCVLTTMEDVSTDALTQVTVHNAVVITSTQSGMMEFHASVGDNDDSDGSDDYLLILLLMMMMMMMMTMTMMMMMATMR